MRATVVEPFAGAGGMALGLKAAGFECVHASDLDPLAVSTLEQIHPGAEVHELTAENAGALAARLPADVTLLAAGVPCQPFSAAGKGLAQYDPRDGFPAFLVLAQWLRPQVVLIENAKGLTFPKNRLYLHKVAGDLEATGYHLVYYPATDGELLPGRVLNAADHGVPQRRERIFIVGFLDHEAAGRFVWPEPTHSEAALVWSKWGDLGLERGGVLGGSYWSEHEPCGLAQVNERGSGHTAPPTYITSGTEPPRRELSVLRRIEAGKLEVTGLRWRTVREAIGDLIALSDQWGDGAAHTPWYSPDEASRHVTTRPQRVVGAGINPARRASGDLKPLDLDNASPTVKGPGPGGGPEPFRHHALQVIGGGGNPHGPGAEHERNFRDLTNEPSPVVAAVQVGNRGPWVANHEEAMKKPASPGELLRNENQGAGFLANRTGPQLRRLTVRECARLQDFPDWLIFRGLMTAQYRQVGNAVPPTLTRVVGCSILKALEV